MDSRRVDFRQHTRKKIRLLLIITFQTDAIARLQQLFHGRNHVCLLYDAAVTIAGQPQKAPLFAFSTRRPRSCREHVRALHWKALLQMQDSIPPIPAMRFRSPRQKNDRTFNPVRSDLESLARTE